MDLRDGFDIDDPPVRVPWSISASELQRLLGSAAVRVGDRYWYADVRVLGGLSCRVSFRFNGTRDGLSTLEFSRGSSMDLTESFNDFQTHFEQAFGPPTSQYPESHAFPSHRWMLPGVEILHHVWSRFGPQESLSIRRFGAA